MIFSVSTSNAALKNFTSDDRELVLLDSDAQDFFDDGVAMMMLATSPNIKLIGVTIPTGTCWSKDGAASAIRQLEGLGINDIPVAIGKTPNYMKRRFKNLDREFEKYGRGFDMYLGAAYYDEPADWLTAYRNKYNSDPKLSPVNENAVDFMIRTIKENPNQVTIIAIGPQTNLAAAIKKSPEIIPIVKRVVYMAGAFFKEGNVTPAAEFNVWLDPTSAKKVVRSPFKEQIFVPLDTCEKIFMTREEFRQFKRSIKSPILKEMINQPNIEERIFETAEKTIIWDALAAAVVIDPSIITEEITMPVDVNDIKSPSYGETLAYRKSPKGAQNAKIVLKIDQKKISQMLKNLFESI